MSTGLALSSTGQPPTVTINTSAALAISSSTTAPRVAWTTGLSRFGWVMITPGCAVRSGGVDIAQLTIPPRRRAGHRREAHERPRLLGKAHGARLPARRTRLGSSERGRGGTGRHAVLR